MNERCEAHQRDLSALHDGELDAREALAAVDHLTDCRNCREFWRGARALQAAAASADASGAADPRPPSDGWERIEAAIREKAESDQRGLRDRSDRRSVPAWAWRIAAALVVGLGLFLTLRSAPPAGNGGEWQPASTATIEVRPGSVDMSERRFVELTTEVLRADPAYHQKMLEVMRRVASPEGLPGSLREGAPTTEDEPESGERPPRRLPGGGVQTS